MAMTIYIRIWAKGLYQLLPGQKAQGAQRRQAKKILKRRKGAKTLGEEKGPSFIKNVGVILWALTERWMGEFLWHNEVFSAMVSSPSRRFAEQDKIPAPYFNFHEG